MEIIDYVSKLLELTKEETENNKKNIDDNLTYYWNPSRGGLSVIVDIDGNFLAATSSISFEELLKEFKKGDKNKNFFKE